MSLENAGNSRVMDIGDREKSSGITIKSTGITLFYELSIDGGKS
jgi:translation elongation factor EF-G